MDYLRDPQQIYAESFRIVREEADLSSLPESLHTVAVRMMHACGMTDLTADLIYSSDVVESALTALNEGAPILTDSEMTAAAIQRGKLPKDNRIICTLNSRETPVLAQRLKTTRSAASVVLWRKELKDSVVLVGNAPTALFALLEMLDRVDDRPSALLACPVGFVGARESKQELADNNRDVSFLTLRGRRGGSAIAGAALNAILEQAGK